jgi:hypothetical protein
MDIRIYYRKLREIEETIPGDAAVVISLETTDGGKAGVASEVSRRTAAKMVLDLRARLADEEETKLYRERQLEALRAAEQLESARRVQVTMVPAGDLRNVKSGNRTTKE